MASRFFNVEKAGRRGKNLSLDDMTLKLCQFVAEKEGVSPDQVQIKNLSRLPGGSSRLLWSVKVEISVNSETRVLDIVLRQDPPGRITAGGMETEFLLLRAAARANVRVPRVYWCEPQLETLGAPFFAMDRLKGETIPRRLLRDEKYQGARAHLCSQLGRQLAAIHSIPIDGSELAGRLQQPLDSAEAAKGEVERLIAGYRAAALEPHPVLDLAARWLLAHLPVSSSLGLVHGDFRIGNMMFDEEGLVAVLDWELAHIGDPAEDLAWLCVKAWRFGHDDLAVGGLGTREELLQAYESAGGGQVERSALHFWEVLGNFKLALVFITQARAFLDGAHATVELASLGRRIAEPEAELLHLMRYDPTTG
ncbi:MAG: hypothetical protein CL917_13995 [Deltaproteobacteria bacterium]|nr:hypothetical protein [Deltaproteobacteria bacterium]